MEIYARTGTPVLVIIAVLALLARGHGGASPAAFLAVAALAFLSGAVVCAVVMFLVLRRRLAQVGAAPPQQPAPAHLYPANPAAIPAPAREPRAIAPAPVVNVHLDADLLAGLLGHHQQQLVRVIPPAAGEDHRG
jgi:hypothetical protein